ncbi:hypothetical protein HanIR_Chr14g0717491 [Helianthus annuus]|nr:hypothetical protein HanIR_Chr14g0717491 [Helianthus annuus]
MKNICGVASQNSKEPSAKISKHSKRQAGRLWKITVSDLHSLSGICSAFQEIFIQEFNGFSLVGAILVVVGEGPTQVSLLFSQHLCRPRKKASSKLT